MRCLVLKNSQSDDLQSKLVSSLLKLLQAKNYTIRCEAITRGLGSHFPYQEYDAVIFLATPGADQPSLSLLDAWQTVLENCLQRGVSHVIYGSSATVYGDSANKKRAEWLPLEPTCQLGLHHALAEQMATYYARKGLKITCLRYFLSQKSKQEASQSALSTNAAAEATVLAVSRALGERFEAINICTVAPAKASPLLPAVYWLSQNEAQNIEGDPAKAFHLLGFYQVKSTAMPLPLPNAPTRQLVREAPKKDVLQ